MFKYEWKMTVTATDGKTERVYTRYGNSIDEMKIQSIKILIEESALHVDVKIEKFRMI